MTVGTVSIRMNNRITLKSLRDYILDAGVTDKDTILLNQTDFDELALEYRHQYNEHIPTPYLLVGVLIREDDKRGVGRGSIIIIEDDTESLRVNSSEVFDPYLVIYRCANCGSLVGSDGRELERQEINWQTDYLSKFKDKANIEPVRGDCCEEHWNPAPSASQSVEQLVDYDVIRDKPLMELTQEDFACIDLKRVESPDFEFIYACRNKRYSKIYFTPNAASYSQRGYMLKEEQIIATTAQLIDAIRSWRGDWTGDAGIGR